MKLVLENGYPLIEPPGFDLDAYDCLEHRVVIEGVCHFEWKHTLTVEFETLQACHHAQQLSGWKPWSYKVLEAEINPDAGYGHPAIVYGDKAFCGFMLMP
ncbi:hypothetical protein EII20_13850 [Comamonadaceae bacterium OH2545_COT-014]|nr:hypothetical protein EII20_13850 [Comamonadaceae bacterium OH2545_COT-014]